MKKIIILKYGELTTKEDNINYFLKTLKNNINIILKDINHTITYDFGRMFIDVKSEDIEKTVEKLKCIFGIHEIIVGYISEDKSLDNIKTNILSLIKDKNFKTFKVFTKRSDKTFPLNSMEISKSLGGYILRNIPNIQVDIHNPELLVSAEIRKNEVLYYFNGLSGLGGYPVGTLGKGLLMLSGGIDSPVAGYLAIKRGVKIEAIYFESPPHTSESAKDKVIKLARLLAKYNTTVKLHVINFTRIQETILKNIPHEYLITIMRRMMYRISAIIAHNSKCNILINGESIGQVASQTLTSMRVINEVIKMPVIRPVACFDKLEIIDLAKKIGTYDISTLPYEDCCTIFVPEHPVINPSSIKAIEYEELIPFKDLIHEAIKYHEIISVDVEEDREYEDIL